MIKEKIKIGILLNQYDLPITSRQPTMRGVVVRRQFGATKHGNENRIYELLSPAHAAAGGALGNIILKLIGVLNNVKKL